ncbi:hypothetical protein BH10PSE19_BH10PSE19_10010 [soil metagenome]
MCIDCTWHKDKERYELHLDIQEAGQWVEYHQRCIKEKRDNFLYAHMSGYEFWDKRYQKLKL